MEQVGFDYCNQAEALAFLTADDYADVVWAKAEAAGEKPGRGNKSWIKAGALITHDQAHKAIRC